MGTGDEGHREECMRLLSGVGKTRVEVTPRIPRDQVGSFVQEASSPYS